MPNNHGDFIWYELLTSNPDAAGRFYESIIGWGVEKSEQPGMDYRMLSMPGEPPVAGLMAIGDEMASNGARPAWLGYVGVDDVDTSAARIASAGGEIHMPPQDIPDVGRFAFVADPQGAMFYVMRGVSDETSLSFAYDRPRAGHCAWNELSTTDPAGAMAFYTGQFGWAKDGEMEMGPLGTYEFLRTDQGMIGAIMPKMPEQPVTAWTFYFRIPDIDVAAAAIGEGGGTIVQEPIEIPGGDFSLVALDPQGAAFGLVGARKG